MELVTLLVQYVPGHVVVELGGFWWLYRHITRVEQSCAVLKTKIDLVLAGHEVREKKHAT